MINLIFSIVSSLLIVAFLTLWERKILSFIQERKGPEEVGALGLLQPFSDGMKLLTKSQPKVSNMKSIMFPPAVFFMISVFFWSVGTETHIFMEGKILLLVVLSSMGGSLVFLSGWNGYSNYSTLGGIRASLQMISYEVMLSFFFLIFCLSFSDMSLCGGGSMSMGLSVGGGMFGCLLLWFVGVLAETNRAPFDLSEGESELVSGFNTEYSSLSFTFLFLGEYLMIVTFSVLSSFFVWGVGGGFVFFLGGLMWVRACFPRKRYDKLMELMWVYMFPATIFFLVSYYIFFLV